MYMFVRVERPRGSKHFVMGYVKCDWVFSFARRFEQMRIRLNSVPPTLLTKMEVQENKALRLECVGETDYERALAKYGDFNDYGTIFTPLGAAIFAKDKDAAEALLDGGEDPNEVDEKGLNALHMAAWKDCTLSLFNRILDMIDNVNAVTFENTALMLAAMWDRLDIVVSLMKHPEVDVNVQDRSNMTALYNAVEMENHAILAQLLSDDRVDTSLKVDNKTPLKYAIKYGHDECVKILREHGAPEY